MNKDWASMTAEEKLEERFRRFMSTQDREFISPQATKSYMERATRFCRAAHMQVTDRVPVISPDNALDMAGISFKSAMYDYAAPSRAYKEAVKVMETDLFAAMAIPSGRIYDLMDAREYIWPGHGLNNDYHGIQFLDKEYMSAAEYDELMLNTNEFLWTKYIPRLVGAFAPLSRLYDLRGAVGSISAAASLLTSLGLENIASLRNLADAYEENMKWVLAAKEINLGAQKAGFPVWQFFTAGGVAPFDDIGNTMRGTRGILMDMHRCPDRLLQAMNFVADMRISRIRKSLAFVQDYPFSPMALHKGGDDFMSDRQFATFYWPPLKRLLQALIDEGFMPMIFAEGYFNRRLDYFKELPRGSVLWWFENTDMLLAHEKLGGYFCIAGGIPNSSLILDTPQEIDTKCRRLIEVCCGDGGFILAGGGMGNVHRAKIENINALTQSVKKYRP